MFKNTIDLERVDDAHEDENKRIIANSMNLNEGLAIFPTEEGFIK